MKKKLFISIALLFLLSDSNVFSQQQIPDNTTGRLWGLCKVWGYMKYYHPKVCSTNWDSLVNEKIPQVMTAASNAAYNTVLLDMVQELGQLSAAQATVPAPADSNLNLDTLWMNNAIFSPELQAFLDTFSSRAGRNDSIPSCFTSSFFHIKMPLSITADYTNTANRLTVAFNFWNNFNYFSPYRDLTDQPWDSVLMNAIPDFINVTDRRGFDTAFSRLHAKIDDSHGYFTGRYPLFIYENGIGIHIERIENKAVVTKVHPEISGIQVGDIVLEVNGITVASIEDQFREYYPASNDIRRYQGAYNYLSFLGAGGPVSVKLSNAAQQEYSTSLQKILTYNQWRLWTSEDTKPEWDTLCNGYGYVNMNKLTPEHVQEMYNALKDQPAIVFDVRSYIRLWIADIAPFFMTQPHISAVLWEQSLTAPGRFLFRQNADAIDSFYNPNPYQGQLYFMVNEKTISGAEYFVQYMQQLPNTTVVGSQTAGADGGSTIVILGNSQNGGTLQYAATYTGVAYPNGYQCQRNGLFIDDPIAPTIAGIRQNIDGMLQHVSGCSSVALQDKSAGNIAISLYPNPASEQLNIVVNASTQENLSIRLTDLIGRTHFNLKDQPNVIQLDISSLESGLYFISLETKNGAKKTVKFIKN